MTRRLHRVGIVGIEPGRSWAAKAHLPALHALSDRFEVVGVANSSRASSEQASAELNLPKAFASVAELVTSPDIDIITVTVRVAHHLEVVRAAIEAGKSVYCEWPLGNGLEEAETLAALARAHGVRGVIGTQARMAPEVQYLKHLIADGLVGEVLSSTITGWGGGWSGVVPDVRNGAYLLDRAQGATMLTIPVGHTLAAVREVLGEFTGLSSVLATRRTTAVVAGTTETLPVTAPDQVLISGVLGCGAPLSLHYRGGMPRDDRGLIWEINGTLGDVRLVGPFGHSQLVPLKIEVSQGDAHGFQPLQPPSAYTADFPTDPVPGNVSRVYALMADDLDTGSRTAPDFDDAVELHKTLSGIEEAASHGRTWKRSSNR